MKTGASGNYGTGCQDTVVRWIREELRTEREFREILGLAEAQYRDAADAFVAAGGERILGPLRV